MRGNHTKKILAVAFFQPDQPGRVGDDGQGGQLVEEGTGHGVEDARNRKADRDPQHGHREDQVLLDGVQRLPGQLDEVRQLRQVVGEERDLRRLDGDTP